MGYSNIDVDEEVIQTMKQYGIDPELARKEIESNKHSNTTTTYYLLMKKLKKSLFTKIYEFPS